MQVQSSEEGTIMSVTYVVGAVYNTPDDTSVWRRKPSSDALTLTELKATLRCLPCEQGQFIHGSSPCPVKVALADAMETGWGSAHQVIPIVDDDGWVHELHALVTVVRLTDGKPSSLPRLEDADTDGAWPVA